MRYYIALFLLLFTAISFAQNTGSVMGTLTDGESNNEPLLFANISVKGTSTEVSSNEYGQFAFESLENGSYTLVCSFIGYESQELQVEVLSGEVSKIEVSLNASSFDMSDLMADASASSEDTNDTALVLNK
jgi:hypothetical protein